MNWYRLCSHRLVSGCHVYPWVLSVAGIDETDAAQRAEALGVAVDLDGDIRPVVNSSGRDRVFTNLGSGFLLQDDPIQREIAASLWEVPA